MIVNKKTFYAVGQGGFYSERIWNDGEVRTIIYDCGSKGSKWKLIQSIEQSGLEKFNCIVLSHLDDDHINGVNKLLKYLRIIQSDAKPLLILPKPTPGDFYLFLKNTSEEGLDDFIDILSSGVPILFISKDKSGKKEEVKLEDCKADVKQMSENTLFYLFDFTNGWQLKFYVDESKYADMIKSPKIRDEIEDLSKRIFLKEEKERKKTIRDVKKLYKCVKRSRCDQSKMNCSSMAMISAPCNEEMRNRNCERGLSSPYVSWLNGDISLKTVPEMADIENHYKDFLSLNIDFQMPHHGSRNNFERLPNVHRRIRTYIWAGEDNDYGHPDGTTLKKLINAGVEINWITEMCKHIIRYEIWI